MLLKMCEKCSRLIEQGTQCEHCKNNRHKEYNQVRRDKSKNEFYHSREWARVSGQARARAYGLDEYAYEYERRLVKGKIAHHIKEIEEAPDEKFDIENLVYVSIETHNRIHAAYEKGKETRKAMQKKLSAIRAKDRGAAEKV
ncbi:MAG: hypothetical protein IJ563_11355 [Selenomonadaceae bacterium]|nr:hypothetical protein [Selenomonadaceae bacterium]